MTLFKRGLLWVLLIYTQLNMIYAQETYTISGIVVDRDTGVPVPYVLVGVPEQEKGISANINGYFKLILLDYTQNHHLQISSLGYERLSVPLSDVDRDQEQRFELKSKPTVLDEVVIIGKSRSLAELVKSASKNRKIYLRSKPYLMNGFYREVLKINNQYQGLTEAQGILYMNGYHPGYKNNSNHLTYDLAQWKHIRRSKYPDKEKRYLEIATLLKAKDYYLHDGPLHGKNINKFHYTVSDTSLYQDRLVLVIDFNPKEAFTKSINYHGQLHIKEDDQALLKLKVESKGPLPFLRNRESSGEIRSHFELSYLLFDGQYYLNHARFKRSYSKEATLINWDTQLIGASFTNQNAALLNYHQRAVLYSEMLNPLMNYDPEFWDDFEYSEGDDLIIMSEQQGDLDQQFLINHNQRLTPLPKGVNSYEQMSNDRDAMDFLMRY